MIDVTEIGKSLLQNLRCSSCKNFLSVSPITLNTSGNSVCGRCQSDCNKDAVLPNNFYELIVHNFIFPCKFVSEGCGAKLSFSKVQTHEECCLFNTVKCQIKDCQWNGILAESKFHYNKHHQQLVVQNKSTNEISEGNGYFLLTIDGFGFLIQWIYSEFMFKIKVTNLDICDEDENISLMYTLSTPDHQEIEKSSLVFNKNVTETFHNLPIKNASHKSKILLSIDATIPSSVVNKRQENSTKTKCQKCSVQMVPPILKCPKAHIICLDCSEREYDYCPICKDYGIIFARVPELERIAYYSQYICKWDGCDETFNFRDIQIHEQVCDKRMYDCLHCSKWHGLFDDVTPHHNICGNTSDVVQCPMSINTEVTFTGIQLVKEIEYSLLAHYEIMWIVTEISDECVKVVIYYNGRPSSMGWFDYEVCLRHVDDEESPFNKTYGVTSQINNRFSIEVPFDDTNRFGGPEFFKIILKIKLLEGEERKLNLMKYFQVFR